MEFNEDTINNLIKDLKEIEDKNVVEGVNGIDNTESSQKNEEKVDITCSVCNTCLLYTSPFIRTIILFKWVHSSAG